MVVVNKDVIVDISLVLCGMLFLVISFYYFNRFGEKAWPILTVAFVFISFGIGARLGEWSMKKKYEVKVNGRKNARGKGRERSE